MVHLPAHGLVAQLLHEVELLLRGSGGGGDGGDDDDDDDCPGPWLRPRRVTSSSAVRQPLPGWDDDDDDNDDDDSRPLAPPSPRHFQQRRPPAPAGLGRVGSGRGRSRRPWAVRSEA